MILLRLWWHVVLVISYFISKVVYRRNRGIVNGEFDFVELYRDLNERYKKWVYVRDPLHGLINLTPHPKFAKDMRNGDCGHFASHIIGNYGGQGAYLMTYFPKPITKAHTVVIYYKNNGYVMVDWDSVDILGSIEELVDVLRRRHKVKIHPKMIFFAKWSNPKQRWVSCKKP